MDVEVVHNPAAQRFEVRLEGHLAVLDYVLRDARTVIFPHTEVPPALEGRGIGSRLARAALDWAAAQGYRVIPTCWFVAGYIRRHPEYQHLLAD